MNTEQKAAWLAEHLLGFPQDSIHEWKPQADWLLTGNGMLKIIEQMRERRFELERHVDYRQHVAVAKYQTGFVRTDRQRMFWSYDEALPVAVIEAAYAALQEDSE